ncbi:MAG: glycosyltransferase family 2 protein [Rhodospirillales bacterium]|nr:glycosyltransferase family 2 protein [Rhodospirillales bacterium]MDE2576553.1 glycosyltransferase family 2 protein [Rhodospirillales bacterium]
MQARHELELTILMPCLNEARTLPACIAKAWGFLERAGVLGEVLIADNGSTDGSQDVARCLGARVIAVDEKGYGSALMAGIRAARGRFVVMGDSDDSYDFSRLDLFLARLREGAQLVMGNRFAGGIQAGAMPALHRYLGNPVLTAVGRMLFRSPCRDFHCGLRGFERDAILQLDLISPGMEFASEMVVRATLARLRIAEVPTSLAPDGRDRAPHLRSWRDGWRHLRLLFLFSPRGLFFYPGAFLFAAGLLAMLRLLAGPVMIGRVGLDINTLMYAAAATIIGWQSMIFWVCATIHGTREGIIPPNPLFERALRRVTLERVLVVSLEVFVLGVLIAVASVIDWGGQGFHALDPSHSMRFVIPAATVMLLSVQAAYGAMFMALLGMRRTGGSVSARP